MGYNADRIIVRIIPVDGAAAEVVIVAGLKAVSGGHFQCFIQHIAAGLTKRSIGTIQLVVAGAADTADV